VSSSEPFVGGGMLLMFLIWLFIIGGSVFLVLDIIWNIWKRLDEKKKKDEVSEKGYPEV
jgi:hypothetical protein